MDNLCFTGVDVGSPRLAGETSSSPDGLEIVAGGTDIWGIRDEFHYACLRVAGDFELSVRLVSLTLADVYTKAGLMVRTSLDSGAEHAFLLAFGDNRPRNHNNGGVEFQYREKAHGPCTGIYPPQPLAVPPDFPVDFPHVWLKLVREADFLTSLHSHDGVRWTVFSGHEQRFPHVVHLGLAVTSHHPTQPARAIFSQVHLKANIITTTR